MKKLLFLCTALLILSCSDDEAVQVEENVTLSLEHYRTTSLLYGTAFLAQENGQIGSSDYIEIPGIRAFSFTPGNRYLINAKKIVSENKNTDVSTVSYELLNVIQKDTVVQNGSFVMDLARFVNGVGYVSWVGGDQVNGFSINREIELSCGAFCNSILPLLSAEDPIRGEFEHLSLIHI